VWVPCNTIGWRPSVLRCPLCNMAILPFATHVGGSTAVTSLNLEVIPEMRSYKMRGEIPSRAMLNVGNIPVDLQVKIEQAIEPYTIFPLLDGEVSGSGTLVTIDGVRGILTARHVVQNWRNSKPKDQHPNVSGSFPAVAHRPLSKSRWSISSAL
jgi:hypothetical protein